MVLGLLAICITMMRCFPQTTLAQWLNRTLVEQPLAWLSKLRRRDIIFLFGLIALLLVANDVMMFGMGELLAIGPNLAVYFDAALSVYFDAVLVATAVTIAAAVATFWRGAHAQISTWLSMAAQRRGRVRRESHTRKTRPTAVESDDASERDFAFAT